MAVVTPETSAVPFCEGIDIIFFESVEGRRSSLLGGCMSFLDFFYLMVFKREKNDKEQ